jgi:alginate O-acetyltransferase complex protein AlgI
MTLVHILAFACAGLLYRPLAGTRFGPWWLFGISLSAVYALQPAVALDHFDFWLPTASLGLAVLAWAATRPAQARGLREPAAAFAALALLVLAIGLTRHLAPPFRLTPTRPPALEHIGAALAVLAVAAAALHSLRRRRTVALLGFALILAMLFALKTEPLAVALSGAARALTGQNTQLARALDLNWLGFSYLAFRLAHALRDRTLGRLPDLGLREFITYAVFGPALTAGPIDRAERFVQDLRAPPPPHAGLALQAGTRLARGLFVKFVVADSLAVFALNPANATQVAQPGWLWLLLYAYALRLYLDFSGYTDIAIGLGLLFGVRLPENFDRPYLRPNLTAFWNAWHMTLAAWFRAYWFNPFTRALRSARLRPPVWLIILVGQLSTMLLIGLWHGVTWNFALWGAWHGLGLFAHNRWTEWLRARAPRRPMAARLERLAAGGGAVLTFHFVTLSWVWFALPDPALSAALLLRLFGL